MDVSEVIEICQSLTKVGKQPSVALIKARLTRGTPLPVIISGLKQFQASPNKKLKHSDVTETQTFETNASALESKLNVVLAHVERLERKIDTLNQQVDSLTDLINVKP